MDLDKLKFKKMQGAGNDFVVIDNREYQLRLKELIELAPRICARRFGVGSDGLLVLNSPLIDGLDYTMIYRNSDGSDAGMCGNGARCLALFAFQSGFGREQKFNVHDNIYRAKIRSKSDVEITFPVKSKIEPITLENQLLFKVNTGTEHVVKELSKKEDLEDEKALRDEGRYFRLHEYFQPLGTNVNFFYGSGENELMLQTYERGVEDLTLACGTGAIASALVWHYLKRDGQESRKEYSVITRGGNLSVEFSFNPESGSYSMIKLKGKAYTVFDGVYYL